VEIYFCCPYMSSRHGQAELEMMGELQKGSEADSKGTYLEARRIWQRLEWLLSDTRVKISILTYLLIP
jgi:hypothetical protein